ncbi:hypothetical protein ACNPQM_42690 [Streptomyces sp. NPDC056231]|uniref:hypothetical protein n=1 Tax=Streptomyces sp. NPDC056231 TaxID=3345755 RepID=UPI003AAC1DE1
MSTLALLVLLLLVLVVVLEKLPGRVRVADGGLLVDAEDEREVERVGAVGEGLFEVTVNAEPLQGGGEVAVGPGGPGCRTNREIPVRTIVVPGWRSPRSGRAGSS